MRVLGLAGLLTMGSLGAFPALGQEPSTAPSANRPAHQPARGMTAAEVERLFGPPRERRSPIGKPPITRWVYDGFTVYFEKGRVLHAVVEQDRGASE